MGVSGNFWDLLKPYVRQEGFDFLRNKRVAVDLSYWIVQQEAALKSSARNPHIRLTFFRTINLFSKFGAFPVFVVDGTPSPLKSKARISRFSRGSGIDASEFHKDREDDISLERNPAFTKCVQEAVELLKLLGMPILKARGEAEALCAQLNREGHVDACMTADSDAFLFGAKCVIKCLYPNSKEPIECYYMSDIEASLGLKKKHLIAISLLVGSDHDLNGVQGIGIDTALRFVRGYDEDEVLNRLHDIKCESNQLLPVETDPADDVITISDGFSPTAKHSHCSLCGHPGNKRTHFRDSCDLCGTDVSESCVRKPGGFKCSCFQCDADREVREMRKQEQWRLKVCRKIAMKSDFPNDKIIDMYLSNNHGYFPGPDLSWKTPNIDMLVDFLVYHQLWEPSYIRKRTVPLLSTNFLREMASNPRKSLLHGQYEFDSIQSVKMRFGHRFYSVKWRKDSPISSSKSLESSNDLHQEEVVDIIESRDPFDDELEVPVSRVDAGSSYLLSSECMELVQAAFPGEVERFLHAKELKESMRKKRGSESKSPNSKTYQQSLTEFYRSKKGSFQGRQHVAENSGRLSEKRAAPNANLSKSVRRRLLFD